MVARMPVELSSISSILSITASSRLFKIDLVLLVSVAVGGMIIEGKIIRLIGIVLVDPGFLSRLPFKLIIVGSRTIEPSRIRSIL